MTWRYISTRAPTVFSATATALLLSLGMAMGITHLVGADLLSVQSGSMAPTFSRGDLVVVRDTTNKQYNIGDVVTFADPQNRQRTITHRIRRVIPEGSPVSENIGANSKSADSEPSDNRASQTTFVTKGDANMAADPPLYAKNIIGKVYMSVPLLGYVFGFARQPLGLLMLIYIPALSIIASELRRLAAYYREQLPYVMTGYRGHTTGSGGLGERPRVARHVAVVAGVLLPGTVTVAASVAIPIVHAALIDSTAVQHTTLAAAPPPATAPATAAAPSVAINHPVIVRVVFSDRTISTGTPPTVTIYNPTNAPIDLSGWKLADNTTPYVLPAGSTIASKAIRTFTWPVTGGLDHAGDRMVLTSPTGAPDDAVSWGGDTSQLKPPVGTTGASTGLARNNINADTGTAADWSVSVAP